jgi:hypothetical protein
VLCMLCVMCVLCMRCVLCCAVGGHIDTQDCLHVHSYVLLHISTINVCSYVHWLDGNIENLSLGFHNIQTSSFNTFGDVVFKLCVHFKCYFILIFSSS